MKLPKSHELNIVTKQTKCLQNLNLFYKLYKADVSHTLAFQQLLTLTIPKVLNQTILFKRTEINPKNQNLVFFMGV